MNIIRSEDIVKHIDWNDLWCDNLDLSVKAIEDFIRKYAAHVDWDAISNDLYLSESFVCEFKDRIYWKGVLIDHDCSTRTIDTLQIKDIVKYIDWNDLWCENLDLSMGAVESFIREYAEYVDWYAISNQLYLSESFVREFKKKVYWRGIFKDRKLSKKFMKKVSYRK